jgi:Flp pilus assembly secretin CpaC
MAGSIALRLSATVCGIALLAVAGAAQAQTLDVQIDRSARVGLTGSAASVIVGNPAIADVTVVDANTLFVTGKGYGVTEVVVVDGVGRTLFKSEIVVTGGSTGSVRVWRGAEATEMACGASCSTSIRNGAGAGAATTP